MYEQGGEYKSSPLLIIKLERNVMKKGDLIVLAIAILLAGGFLLFNGYRNQSEDEIVVEVRIDGDVVDTFSLDEDIDKLYESEFGMNELTILGGVVAVSDADCRDQICVDTKHGTNHGDAIVCVPNRFTVELLGDGGDIDAIAR